MEKKEKEKRSGPLLVWRGHAPGIITLIRVTHGDSTWSFMNGRRWKRRVVAGALPLGHRGGGDYHRNHFSERSKSH